MSATASMTVPWWKEPTKEQWHAWIAAWLGWTLNSFDFTVFLLIMVPIAKEFDVPLVITVRTRLAVSCAPPRAFLMVSTTSAAVACVANSRAMPKSGLYWRSASMIAAISPSKVSES